MFLGAFRSLTVPIDNVWQALPCHFMELERTNVYRSSEKVIQAMESDSVMTMFLEGKRKCLQRLVIFSEDASKHQNLHTDQFGWYVLVVCNIYQITSHGLQFLHLQLISEGDSLPH
jgi:hypothetical protein